MFNDYPTVLAVISPLFRSNNLFEWPVIVVIKLRQHPNTLLAQFVSKVRMIFGYLIIFFSLCMFYFVYDWSQTLCIYWQYLTDCNAQKKSRGSKLRFWNLASSITITYMLAVIGPRRFCEHQIYHIILQQVKKRSYGSRSSDSWCNS